MYGKSERIIFTLIVIAKLCNCSFEPFKAENYDSRTVGQRIITQNKIASQIAQQSRVFSYTGAASNEKYAELGDFTYQVPILYYGSPMCNGALLSDRWVISSAQCASNMLQDSLIIVVGGLTSREGDMYLCEAFKIHDSTNTYNQSNILGGLPKLVMLG